MRLFRGLGALIAFACACAVLLPAPGMADEIVSGYGRHIYFAARDWQTKVSNVPVGPGPNVFSDNSSAIWTDDQDRLHMTLAQDPAGQWQSAEVVLQRSLGYGTYCFYLEGMSRPLDPNVVLGMFTWSDDPVQSHRELDIELSEWSQAGGPAGRYSVQPFELPDHMYSFDEDVTQPVTQCMQWQAGRVSFASWQGWTSTPSADAIIASRVFTDGVPQPGDEQVRINLWLLDGRAPTDGQTAEVVVAGFQFTCDPIGPAMSLCDDHARDP
jgi:hypothetical protein